MRVNFDNLTKEKENNKSKIVHFILTLIIGDKLLHNSMIDLGDSSIFMPKKIVEALHFRRQAKFNRIIMQLDGKKVQSIGIIKELPFTYFPSQIS